MSQSPDIVPDNPPTLPAEQRGNLLQKRIPRRGFLQKLGAGATLAGLVTVGCSPHESKATVNPANANSSELKPVLAQEQPTSPTPTPTPEPETVLAQPNTESETAKLELLPMKELANRRGQHIGTLISPGTYIDKDLISKEFNLIQPGTFSWNWIYRNGLDNPDFSLTDQWADFARKNNMKVRGQPLVYHIDLPKALIDARFNRQQLIDFMTKHIQMFMKRYPDFEDWVVTNEVVWAAKGTWGYTKSIFLDTIGPEYIEIAHQVARDANPEAKLIYNDSGAETQTPKSDVVFDLVQRLKRKNLVDKVGSEMHVVGNLNGNPDAPDPLNFPSEEVLIAQMQRYKELGIPVVITEMDVDVSRMEGNLEQKFQQQANIYATVVRASIRSGNCEGINFWGYEDGSSWLVKNGGKGQSPSLYIQSTPKPAVAMIKKAYIEA